MFLHCVAVPLIEVYLFLFISLFPKIIGKIGVFMGRDVDMSVVISCSAANGEEIVRSIGGEPKQSGGGTVVFGQQERIAGDAVSLVLSVPTQRMLLRGRTDKAGFHRSTVSIQVKSQFFVRVFLRCGLRTVVGMEGTPFFTMVVLEAQITRQD